MSAPDVVAPPVEPSDEAVARFAVIAAQACRELAVKDAERATTSGAVA